MMLNLFQTSPIFETRRQVRILRGPRRPWVPNFHHNMSSTATILQHETYKKSHGFSHTTIFIAGLSPSLHPYFSNFKFGPVSNSNILFCWHTSPPHFKFWLRNGIIELYSIRLTELVKPSPNFAVFLWHTSSLHFEF